MALATLSDMKNAAEREVYLGIVASKSGVSVDTLRSTLAGTRPAEKSASEGERTRKAKETVLEGAARFVLGRLLNRDEYASPADVEAEWMPLPEQADILRFVKEHADRETLCGDLLGAGIGGEETSRVLDAEKQFLSAEKERVYYADCLAQLSRAYDKRQIEELKAKFNEIADAEERRTVLEKIQSLQRKIRQ